MPAEKDPFSLVYDGLWACLESSPAFTSAIPSGNRIKYNTQVRQPKKPDGLLTSDFPEVKILPRKFTAKPFATSDSCFVDQVYAIGMAMGDLRVDEFLNPMKLLVLSGLVNYRSFLLPLTWLGNTFVKVLRIGESSESKFAQDEPKNIQGWVTVMPITIEMTLNSTLLQNLTLDQLQGAVFTQNPMI